MHSTYKDETVHFAVAPKRLISNKNSRHIALHPIISCYSAFARFSISIAYTSDQTNTGSADIESAVDTRLDTWMLAACKDDHPRQFEAVTPLISKQIGEPDPEQAVYWYKRAAQTPNQCCV